MDTRYYDLFMHSKLRENEIESLYRDLMYINRLDVPDDIKYHMKFLVKMDCKERKAKHQMNKVITEINLYSYYSWGLFKGADILTIIEEQAQSLKFAAL